MDFINPEEQAREAKLDYGEAESLLRFLNFQHERRGEPPISTDYGQLCERLSEIHPDVEFKLDGHRIVARVKDGAGGSLVDRIGFVSSQIPYLAAPIGFGSDSFEAVFRADGIGVIKEDSWYEFFEHDLNLEESRRDCNNDRDAINGFLQDHFNEHIGPQMEDPFFDPSGEDCELYFETGSKEELERLIRMRIGDPVFFRQKCAAQRGLQLKHIKVIARNQFARDKLTLVSTAEAKALVFESR